MTDSEKKQWQKYFDDAISHAIKSVEYGNYFYDQINLMVTKAKNDCQKLFEKYKRCGIKSRCFELKKEIDVRLKRLESDINIFIDSEIPKIIENENDYLEDNIIPFFNITLDDSEKVFKKLSIIPVATAGSAAGFGLLISDRLRTIYNSEITQSYVTGIPFKEIEDDYNIRLNSFNRGLQTDSETLGSSLGEQYERIVFTKNKGKIKRYVWTSMMDTSTCLACGMLDGQIFDDITQVHIYPLHDRCRCKILPLPDYVDDEEDFKISYSAWFENQSDKTKHDILGKGRFQLYEQGMKIRQFVNNGKITPLKELKNKTN